MTYKEALLLLSKVLSPKPITADRILYKTSEINRQQAEELAELINKAQKTKLKK